MRWLKFILLAYVALILQTAFLPVVFPDHLRPSALIVLANLYLLSRPDEWTILMVWLAGLLGDLTSLSPLGSQAVAFGLFGLLILTVRPVLFADSPLAHAITSAMGVIIISAIYAILTVLTPHAMPLPYSVVEVVGQAFTTALLAALVSRVLSPSKKAAYSRR